MPLLAGRAWRVLFRTPPAIPAHPDNFARRPVSRVLSACFHGGRPFLWDAPHDAPLATNPNGEAGMPLPLRPKARGSRSYSVLLPVGFTLPPLLPGARCAFAAPFRPCPRGTNPCAGGLFSVALSLGSPPPAVSRHRIPVEPGLSSMPVRTQRPSSRLASAGHERRRATRQAFYLTSAPAMSACAPLPSPLPGIGRKVGCATRPHSAVNT